MCRLATSPSISRTSRLRSRARLSARLMLVKVLPSPGTALVTTTRFARLGASLPDMDLSSGRLMIL